MAWATAVVSDISIGTQLFQSLLGGNSARALDKLYAQNAKLQADNAVRNFSQQANANISRYAQEQEAMWQKAQQNYLDNLQAKATAQTSVAGSGITGVSIENLFKGYDRANAINNFISERNLRNMGLQYDANYEALRTNAINSIYGIQSYTGETQGSTILKSMGGLMNTGANAYINYLSSKGGS